MCGIYGFLTKSPLSEGELIHSLNQSSESLFNRGPDACGVWTDTNSGVFLAHRRLSIVDLTPAGSQPMVSNNGRYVVILNGEIYNHKELRSQLLSENIVWKGNSDTETLINCIQFWGIEKTLKSVTGMFAFAVWDREENVLSLARDRIGEKPLYYGWQNGTFHFGSNLGAIKKSTLFIPKVDRDALSLFVRFGYVPTPYSIYKDIFKLEPGTFIRVSLDSTEIVKNIYWSTLNEIERGVKSSFVGTKDEAIAHLEDLLFKSIEGQMMADVPLGAFLSGGVDSSLIVAMMQSKSSIPINTFSIGFSNELYNEADFAKKVANYLGTNHTEYYVTEKDTLDVIQRLPDLFGEPFADSSQIPTYLVSEIARKSVTVSLSGDAGDELFGGYNRYLFTLKFWNRIKIIPLPIREIISRIASRLSPGLYNKVFGFLNYNNVGDKIHKSLNLITSRSQIELYLKFTSVWQNPTDIVLGSKDVSTMHSNFPIQIKNLDFISQMMSVDLMTYLADDILCKVDRAAMGVSLETRVPFLDHKVMEFAFSLPLNYKIYNNQTKWILRQVLYKYVPKELIERPKMGFGIPIDEWLRGELKDWAESLLNKDRLIRDGYFNPEPILEKWQEHLSGKRNWAYQLWNILIFQMWFDNQ